MMRAYFKLEVASGRPNLQLPDTAVVAFAGQVLTVAHGEHYLIAKYLGRDADNDAVLYGYGSKRIFQALSHLGARVRRPSQLTTGQRNFLKVRGVQEHSGRLHTPVLFAGHNPRQPLNDGDNG
jgi:hypothetical protein